MRGSNAYQRGGSRWLVSLTTNAGAAFLILACLIYFKLTRPLSLVPGWYFLALFPVSPSWRFVSFVDDSFPRFGFRPELLGGC